MATSPLVTAILLTYNCEDFVAEALRSVLAQDCGPMEILISDDASEDDTFEVLNHELATYAGPHRVRLQRRPVNSGTKSAHLNDVFPSCAGEILVSFDGDDVSVRHRVRRIVDAFHTNPEARAIYSRYSLMDAAGRPLGPPTVPHPASGQEASTWFARVDANASGATLAVRREVVEKFPPLAPEIAEDIVLPFRASLLGDVVFLDESLVKARRHAGSLTTDLERFESIERYRERHEAGIERAAGNLESRRADLRVAETLFPSRAARAETAGGRRRRLPRHRQTDRSPDEPLRWGPPADARSPDPSRSLSGTPGAPRSPGPRTAPLSPLQAPGPGRRPARPARSGSVRRC
jgi:hypothetical protein